jgi:hypothetical protein
MDKKKDGNMLNIKTEEQVIKKTVHKIGIWLSVTDIMTLIEALSRSEAPLGGHSGLIEELSTIHDDALHQINEKNLNIEAEEEARNGDKCETEGCE